MKPIELSREQARRAQNSVLPFDKLKTKITRIDLPADVLIKEDKFYLAKSNTVVNHA